MTKRTQRFKILTSRLIAIRNGYECKSTLLRYLLVVDWIVGVGEVRDKLPDVVTVQLPPHVCVCACVCVCVWCAFCGLARNQWDIGMARRVAILLLTAVC